MDKFRGYMKKLKTSANQLVGDRGDQSPDTAIELDAREYEILRQRAERQNTTVQALVSRAVKQFIEQQSKESRSQVSLEQKERNPMLHLDALTQSLD
jgi:hypothetical protein